MASMARSVGGDKNRFDAIVFQELFQRGISPRASAGQGKVPTAVRQKIADRDHFNIGVILKPELGGKFAETISDETDTNSAIRNRSPLLGGVRIRGLFFKSLDDRLGARGLRHQGKTGGYQT